MTPRFRWSSKGSFQACVCMAAARARLGGMEIERAVELTLPKHSRNPASISAAERKRIVNAVKGVMEGSGARRRGRNEASGQ